MDYSKVDTIVDFRETNFPSNPKSWRNDGTGWPYSSVATTAVMKLKDKGGENVMIYSEISNNGEPISLNTWDVTSLSSSDQMDAYFSSLTLPEVDGTELLLVNPDLIYDQTFRHQFHERVGKQKNTQGLVEAEILTVHNLLKWCWHDGHYGSHTVSKTSASQSCYGKGR
jgi:hypothetical protein